SALRTGELPTGITNNIHAIVDQEFATDALSAIITSGDLADFINRAIARHVPVVDIVPIDVNGGSVTFETGQLLVSLDGVARGACVGNKDLGFTATISGTPKIKDGKFTIETSNVDIDLDDVDAGICAVTSALLGPL